jgi:hypothetical protein
MAEGELLMTDTRFTPGIKVRFTDRPAANRRDPAAS